MRWIILLIYIVVFQLAITNGNEEAQENGEPDKCSEEMKVDSTVRVASLRIEEVKIPLIFSVFVLIVILVKMGWHHTMMSELASRIPESLVLITIGTFIGGFLVSAFLLDECNRDDVFPIRFTPQLFFIILLPPIVFASGYFMNIKSFFENFITIIIFALIGTIWNAFALGFTLFGLSKAGLVSSDLSIASALLYGTITAAVDPVAVLAVFDEIHVNKLLHILVFGESLLNDAVTIVLFEVLGAFANIPFDDDRSPDSRQQGIDAVIGIVQFFVVVFASIVIGIICGCGGVLLTRISQHVHVLEPVMLLVIGYISYIMADLFAFSGIVSLITCSIIMKHYVPANIAWKSNVTFKYSLKMLSIVSEMVIFLFLGISLFDNAVHKWDTGLVLFTLLFAAIFRPIGVILLSLLVNLGRLHKISMKMMFIMSYSGLRGAVAFSLALTRIFEEGYKGLPAEEQDVRKSMLTATTVLLLFTVFVQGTTIKPLVKKMRIKVEVSHRQTINEIIHKTAIDHIATGMEDIAGHFGFNVLKEFFQYVDVKYLRKIFERHTEAVDEEIIRKFQTIQFKESRSQIFEHAIHTPEDEPLVVPKDPQDTSVPSEPEDEACVPALGEVLRMSYPHPHESHFMHVLSREEQEIQDHHLARVKVEHRIKRRNRKRTSTFNLRRRTTLGRGYSKESDEQDSGATEKEGSGGVYFKVEEVDLEPSKEGSVTTTSL